MNPQWKGLFEWSMKYSDGTRVSDFSQIEVDPQKMSWLQEVLSNYVKDLVQRMKEIKKALEEPENEEKHLEEQENLLDELQEIVEDLDQAKNLHLIGGVPMLKDLLRSDQTTLRWRAAEVVATCVQNNHDVQKAFYDEGVLPLVMDVASSFDLGCQIKGWMAISCMIRNFSPASDAFLKSEGLKKLLKVLEQGDERLLRRCLFLLDYVVSLGNKSDFDLVYSERERLIKFLDSEDADIREKTLGLLVSAANTPHGRAALNEDSDLKEAIARREQTLSQSTVEAPTEELDLLRSLRNAPNNNSTPADPSPSSHSDTLLLKM